MEPREVVLAGFRDFDAGDWDAFAARVDPAVYVTGIPDWPEPGPWRDREEYVAQFKSLTDGFERSSPTRVEVVTERGDWVVVDFRWEVQGTGSGLETAFDISVAFRVTEDRLAEAHYRWTKDEALVAAGLAAG